jgi:methylenetetrahydrofolate dehydrogenase (NADP+)/methenyltetrahydrofolate cyclohydrolase
VDGFHPYNVGGFIIGSSLFIPCTPRGIMELIARTGIELSGKDAVVVRRSNIVGKPMVFLLLAQNATVAMCHSNTKDLSTVTGRADDHRHAHEKYIGCCKNDGMVFIFFSLAGNH